MEYDDGAVFREELEDFRRIWSDLKWMESYDLPESNDEYDDDLNYSGLDTGNKLEVSNEKCNLL